MQRLAGKRALITGGTSGIGLETARQFIQEGAQVAITGRNELALAQARAALGAECWPIRSDAGVVADQIELARQLAERWGKLDVLFINAADVAHRPFGEWDEAAFDSVLSTNLKGPFFLLQHLLPLLANPSSVILCGSISAHIGFPHSSAYAASKAALLSLARTLSRELHPYGVRVNGLSPGPTHTPALDKLNLDAPAQEQLRQQIDALVPLGRMGRPEEVAAAAVFLATDESTFMLGTEVTVDGGARNL